MHLITGQLFGEIYVFDAKKRLMIGKPLSAQTREAHRTHPPQKIHINSWYDKNEIVEPGTLRYDRNEYVKIFLPQCAGKLHTLVTNHNTDFAVLAEYMRQCGSTLTSLDISSHSEFPEDFFSTIGQYCSSLRKFTMGRTKMASEALFVTILANNRNLRSLILSQNFAFTDVAIFGIAQHCRELEYLEIHVSDKFSSDALKQIAEHCKFLRFVSLDFLRDVEVANEFLFNCKYLTKLHCVGLTCKLRVKQIKEFNEGKPLAAYVIQQHCAVDGEPLVKGLDGAVTAAAIPSTATAMTTGGFFLVKK